MNKGTNAKAVDVLICLCRSCEKCRINKMMNCQIYPHMHLSALKIYIYM